MAKVYLMVSLLGAYTDASWRRGDLGESGGKRRTFVHGSGRSLHTREVTFMEGRRQEPIGGGGEWMRGCMRTNSGGMSRGN